MLYFAPWKKFAILAICLAGLVFSMPNLFYETADQASRARAEIERTVANGGTPETELRETAAKWPSVLPGNVVNLGLDLRGGVHLLVEVQISEVVAERMVNLRAEAGKALRDAGVRRFQNLRATADHVSVRITEPDQLEAARAALQGLAQPVGGFLGGGFGMGGGGGGGTDLVVEDAGDQSLRLSLTEPAIAQMTDRTMAQSLEIIRRRIDEAGTREPSIQRQGDDRILVQVPGLGSAEELLDLIGRTAKLTFHKVAATGADATVAGPGQFIARDSDTGEPMLLESEVILSGENLTDSQLGFHPQNGLPVVNFRFDTRGARIFGQYTSANLGQLFAIVLDNEIVSAPRIQSAILGGSGYIEGNFTAESASALAILLRSGALPASIKVLEQRTIGPELGADSVAAGSLATLVAFVAVMIFMVGAYGRFGLFANIALMLNVALIMAALSVMGATLTLPGIAGIVLTIGMAVDANVLIFERIREELKTAKGPARAVERGYEQAFSAIIDANVTTLIAAVILFGIGSGPVKGFAVTLGIGIVTSVFTAVVVTRLMMAMWLERSRPKTMRMGLLRMVRDETHVPFMSMRKVAVGLSGVAVIASIALAGVLGFNYGIDFRGGTMIIAQTPEKVAVGEFRDVLTDLGVGDVAVTEISSVADEIGAGDAKHQVMIRIEQQAGGDEAAIQAEDIDKTKAALTAAMPGVSFQATESVGAKVSGELLQAGIMAVVLAVVAVLVYIWLRFEWQFGLGAVIALLHDVALTIGVFAITGIEFNLAIIAAILTIVGYSLNDTVVVFDRVRENLRKYKKMELGELLDLSINETLSRTLMTAITTLVALAAMYVLGPQVIEGFTFAMIWGIVVGTYSSVFVAAAILLWLGVKRDWSTEGPTKAGIRLDGAQDCDRAPPVPAERGRGAPGPGAGPQPTGRIRRCCALPLP